jgi:hypothetical protein
VQCSSILPYSAKVAIWCSIRAFLKSHSGLSVTLFKFLVGSVGLVLCLYIFVSCRRSKRAAIYHVEANQINGPSLGAPFDPRTATLSATYPKTPEIVISPAPPRGTPNSSYFATAQQENLAREIVKGWPKPPQTAPVSNANPYPFAGHSPVSCTLRHLIIGSGKNGSADDAVVIVFRSRLHNSHALRFKVGSLGHYIQDNHRKEREAEKFTRNGSNG